MKLTNVEKKRIEGLVEEFIFNETSTYPADPEYLEDRFYERFNEIKPWLTIVPRAKAELAFNYAINYLHNTSKGE